MAALYSHHPEAATGTPSRKMQLKHQLRGNTLQGWGAVLQNAVSVLNQGPPDGTVPPTGSWMQKVNAGMAPLTINDSAENFVLPIPTAWGFAGLEALVPTGMDFCQVTKQGSC